MGREQENTQRDREVKKREREKTREKKRVGERELVFFFLRLLSVRCCHTRGEKKKHERKTKRRKKRERMS